MILVKNRKLLKGSFPVFDRHHPLLTDVVQAKINQPINRFIVREDGTALDDLSQTEVERLDEIDGIDNLTNLHRQFKHQFDARPIGPPGARDDWVLLVPLYLKLLQGLKSFRLTGGLIDQSQISGHHFTVLIIYKAQRMPNQMHDAGLDRRLRENALDCFGQALQAVNAGDKDVFHAP